MLLVAAAAAVGIVALARSSGSDDAEARLERCVGPPEREGCLQREYARAAQSGDVAATLAALQSLAQDGRVDDCHLEAHRLANAVFRVVGDVERTFLLGGPACRFGYLHGAVEATGAVAATGALATHGVAIPRCGRFRISVQRRACAHGLGHALMLRTGHDLRASLEGCAVASRRRSIDAPACTAGVMMENSLRYADQRGFARAAARRCANVASSPALERSCLENIGVVAALANAHDDERAAAVCRSLAPARPRELCLTGAADEVAESRRSR